MEETAEFDDNITVTATGTHEIPLWQLYPVAGRYALRKSCYWLIVAIGALIFGMYWVPAVDPEGIYTGLVTVVRFLTWISIGVFTFFYIRATLYRLTLRYFIRGDYFMLKRGIVLQHESCFPLSRISEILVRSNLMDLIFGLEKLCITAPGVVPPAVVPGLPRKTARALESAIAKAMEKKGKK